MRYSESEIVEDILEHIRQAGGEFDEWRVGSAGAIQDERFKIQEQMLYRPAYTVYAAEEVVERLASGCGLERDPASAPGKIVYVYRPAAQSAAA